jgi:cytoskeletal protein CcmA (bactofilin family)
MFGNNKEKQKKKKEKEKKNVGTVISEGTSIEGTVEVDESIRVDGKLEGKLIASGDVFIGKSGGLKADVKADNVMIAGVIEGNVEAEGKLEIVSTGKLKGDICISNLIIHDGGVFEGNSTSGFEDSSLVTEEKKGKTNVGSLNKKENKGKDKDKNKDK